MTVSCIMQQKVTKNGLEIGVPLARPLVLIPLAHNYVRAGWHAAAFHFLLWSGLASAVSWG